MNLNIMNGPNIHSRSSMQNVRSLRGLETSDYGCGLLREGVRDILCVVGSCFVTINSDRDKVKNIEKKNVIDQK